jgi:hypothetical protein
VRCTYLLLTQSGHQALRRVRIHRVAGPTPSSIDQVAILQLIEVILAAVLDPNDMLVLIRTRLCSLLGGAVMNSDRAIAREKKREEFANLRNAALADLERQGYGVRGKTPRQIREMLKRRPKKLTQVRSK